MWKARMAADGLESIQNALQYGKRSERWLTLVFRTLANNQARRVFYSRVRAL